MPLLKAFKISFFQKVAVSW